MLLKTKEVKMWLSLLISGPLEGSQNCNLRTRRPPRRAPGVSSRLIINIVPRGIEHTGSVLNVLQVLRLARTKQKVDMCLNEQSKAK